MRNRWNLRLCIPLIGAAVLIGCNRQDRSVADPLKTSQQITVSGCLSSGMGTNQYMLTEVRLTEQPSDARSPITPHTQVRLAVNDRSELAQLFGERVTVTGALTNDGSNTIGTSGRTPPSGSVDARDDRSQAATEQHYASKVAQEAGPIGQRSMNNGTFPEITVAKIEGSGEKCQGWH